LIKESAKWSGVVKSVIFPLRPINTNVWVGVLIPWLVAALWFSVIVTLLYGAGRCKLIWFLVVIFIIFFGVS
jgi:hypothetical protein